MLSLEQARERILGVIPPARAQTVALDAAAGRFIFHNIEAPIDLPPFDNSAMDGYAVLSNDVVSASAATPVSLRVRDRIPAGDEPHSPVTSGTCTRIFTGSPLPPGADAVIMQEDTKTDSTQLDHLLFLESAKPWENVRLRGEDIRVGTTVATAGTRLHSGMVALMAGLGIKEITVSAQPTVGLLATGNELLDPGDTLAPGKIFESNRLVLGLLTTQAGGQPRRYPLVRDSMDATRSALQRALDECDILVTTGGVSVGELDFVKEAFTSLGGQLDFWRVSIKPGRPFVFGQRHDKYLFGLPGNPISAFVTFLVLVRPALLKWQAAAHTSLASQPGTLTTALRNSGDRRHFMRVRVDNAGKVHLTGTQASHMLNSVAQCNGLIDVPPETEWPPGREVEVLRWDVT